MSRVETIGSATLYLGDCREILPTLGKVDVVVTDPPYGIGYVHGGGTGFRPMQPNSFYRRNEKMPIIGDDAEFDPAPILQWPCVLFGGNHFYNRLPKGGTFHVWDKHCGRGVNDNFSDAEFIWTSWRCASEIVRYLWKGILQDGEKQTVRHHPSQKPIAVMAWCLQTFVKGNVILDPFMGSGTTGVAAIKLGRKFIGIEIEPKYFDIACRRIDGASRQKDLFIETKDDAVAATMPELLL